MTRQQAAAALTAKLQEALSVNKIGYSYCRVIGSMAHVECRAASSANRAADILANFCGKVSVWDSINDDDRNNIHKVYRVAGRIS